MAIPVPENLLPAYLRESDRVIYSDGNVHGSLYWLSFCQICKELRNKKGMMEEIEQHRCTSCLETFTLTENNEKEKRCPVCFDCPSCGQTLIIRTALLPPSGPPKDSPEEKPVQEKRFHLVCQTCRWTSRAAGIPDAIRLPTVTSPWRFTLENAQEPKDELTPFADYFRALSLSDKPPVVPKSSHKSKRHVKAPGYSSSILGDKYKLVSVAQKRIASGNLGIPLSTSHPDLVVLEARLPKVEFIEKPEEVSEEILVHHGTAEEADKRMDWRQRLLFPSEQPETIVGMLPRRKPLTSKLVWKCRKCTHLMIKTDYTAQSINYKINSAAPLLVPTIQPCKPAKFIVGEICEFVVVMRNPLGHNVHMSFSLPQPDESVPSWLDGVMANELVVPSTPVILLNRACAADDKVTGGPESLAGEDSSCIAFRKLYTVGLRFSCVPVSAETDNWVSFNIRYDFQETQTTVFTAGKTSLESAAGDDRPKEPITTWIAFRIDMNLGRAVEK